MLVGLHSFGYNLITLREYLVSLLITSHSSLCILRHDVDRLRPNALQLAQIKHSLGIRGTYYFRIVPESYDLEIMEKIARLGHEVGYHYEDVSLAAAKLNIKGSSLKIKDGKDQSGKNGRGEGWKGSEF